jgi:hypothetical protein
MTMKIDRTILDSVGEEAPQLWHALVSVMPFFDLFSDEGGIGYDDDGEVYYAVTSEAPLPDEDGSLPEMHWYAEIYEDRVEVSRLQKQDGITRIRGTETLSLREFWHLLRRYSVA